MPSSPQAPVYLVNVGNRVGVKGWSVAPHDFLRKTENLCLFSTLFSLPNGITEHVVFS